MNFAVETNMGDRYIVLPICATPVYVHVVFTHSNSPWPEVRVIFGFKHPCAKRLMKQDGETIDFANVQINVNTDDKQTTKGMSSTEIQTSQRQQKNMQD